MLYNGRPGKKKAGRVSNDQVQRMRRHALGESTQIKLSACIPLIRLGDSHLGEAGLNDGLVGEYRGDVGLNDGD